MTTIIVQVGTVEVGRVTLPRSADAVLDALVHHEVVLEINPTTLLEAMGLRR